LHRQRFSHTSISAPQGVQEAFAKATKRAKRGMEIFIAIKLNRISDDEMDGLNLAYLYPGVHARTYTSHKYGW
jgi:hypothetical protein